MTEPPPLSLAQAVEQAATQLAADPAGAARAAETILNLAPKDPRARLILASARRRLGDPAAAARILALLAQAFPRAANTQYELGLTLAALNQTQPAAEALRRAVSLNPELADAWRALGDLMFAAGDLPGAKAAFAEQARRSVSDPALRPAADALFEGRLDDAERHLRTHLLRRPDDPAGLRLLAEAYLHRARYADAEVLLRRCLDLDPDYDGARFNLADALFRQQKAAEAVTHVRPLLARAPRDAAYRNLMAACLSLLGEDQAVIGLYESLLADYPSQPRIWLNFGHTLRAVGRSQAAIDAYRRCIALAPELGDAYWSLANLKMARFSEAELAALKTQAARADLSADDRLHLRYALGKALEDQGDAAGSFEHYAAGAAIRRGELAYDADETTAFVERSVATLSADFFADRAGWGAASDAPIFVVGLPRSGSTLVEQILASHSAIEGTMELPYAGLIALGLGHPERATRGPRYPECLAALTADQAAALGEAYLDAARAHRKLGRPLFIDKMPNNFNHIGLIQLILPRAKIIDVRRHPLGAGFSAFKQHFAQGQGFSYDLADIGRYYRDYVALMRRIDQALPGRAHRVIYEDLIEDTEAEVRRLLAYCGLDFEPACLTFHTNDRAVRTVSSEQVRRPIFRDGLEQWRRYEPWLEPLKTALGPALERWRD